MKIQDLFESPTQTFPTDFGLSDAWKNEELARKYLKRIKTPIQSLGNGTHTLYEIEGNQGKEGAFVLINHVDNEHPKIEYLMRYNVKFYGIINTVCAQQIKVWVNVNNVYTENLAKNIFFNHLLQNWQTVITDSMQTADGERFWGRRIANAFQLGYNVYYLSQIPKKEIIKINNENEFEQLKNNKNIWGGEEKHLARRIIISIKNLD